MATPSRMESTESSQKDTVNRLQVRTLVLAIVTAAVSRNEKRDRAVAAAAPAPAPAPWLSKRGRTARAGAAKGGQAAAAAEPSEAETESTVDPGSSGSSSDSEATADEGAVSQGPHGGWVEVGGCFVRALGRCIEEEDEDEGAEERARFLDVVAWGEVGSRFAKVLESCGEEEELAVGIDSLNVDAWVDVGKRFAKALASCSEEEEQQQQQEWEGSNSADAHVWGKVFNADSCMDVSAWARVGSCFAKAFEDDALDADGRFDIDPGPTQWLE